MSNYNYRVAKPIEFNEAQLGTLKAILDTFIAPLPKAKEDELVERLKATHTEQEVRQFSRFSSSSFDLLGSVTGFIDRTVLPEKKQELLSILSLLSSRTGTFALTGHFSEFKNIPVAEREKIFLSWKDSYLSQLRLIYKTLWALACHSAYAYHNDVLGDAMRYNTLNNDKVYDNLPPRFTFLDANEITDLMHFDAIIVGSGAGGGVVASQLAQGGKSILVIEKGAYFHETEFSPTESSGYKNLYEFGGFGSSYEGSFSLLAGSVFGGGTTINWSASLKPQHFVREEWAKQGLTHFTSPKFSRDLDKVFERIGASTAGISHNGANQVLVDGCKALGYPIADIPQNTNGRPHECESCYAGCRAGIKNGTMNSWLRDAADHGAKFLEKTKVHRVLIENGKAVGVECTINHGRKVQIRADQVVVSAGSLQSPGVLLRSGLKNKNIGRNLRLHPATLTAGFFDKKIRCFEGAIMTAVSSVVDNLENDGYGAKLEVPCLPPGSYATVFPWLGAAEHKELMMRYEQCAPILILTRDKDSVASVRYDASENLIVDFKLSKRDRKSTIVAIDKSFDVLVAAGARMLVSCQFGIEAFKFEDGEESSILNPRYIEWKKKVVKYGFPKDSAGIFGAHQMGSNRMGISPKTSVVKPTGETWEVKDLFVADASVFPTASGVNPMVTNEAICLHIADSILNKNSNAKL